MGGIVKSVFGGGGGKGRKVDLNRQFTFGDSSMRGGRINLDPRFQQLRSQYLGGVQGLQGLSGALSGFGGQFGQLGQEFAGNQGALIAARMSPLQQNIARQRGQLTQNIGRRGLMGSSFGNQALTGFETEAGRALGEAQAMATADALQARAGLLGQQMGAEQANIQNQVLLNELLGGASGQFLQQELAGLGLGAQTIQGLLGSQAQQDQIAAQSRAQDTNLLGSLLGAGGALLTGGLTSGLSGVPTTYAGSTISQNPSVWGY